MFAHAGSKQMVANIDVDRCRMKSCPWLYFRGSLGPAVNPSSDARRGRLDLDMTRYLNVVSLPLSSCRSSSLGTCKVVRAYFSRRAPSTGRGTGSRRHMRVRSAAAEVNREHDNTKRFPLNHKDVVKALRDA